MHRTVLVAAMLICSVAFTAKARGDLPVVEEVEWGPFRAHCRQLLAALDKTASPLPAKTVREVKTLLDRAADDGQAVAVQKLLDPHCLLAVSINPESRVKAARGPADARLRRNRATVVLVKIHNDGGVTHALRLRGSELIHDGERGDGRWLDAAPIAEAPFAVELSGRRLEYRLLRLTPREAGKREATFQFDVGQGTQDLGFRAEVPILFSVRRDTP
jgi:hypothetical protein